jgi:RNA polymerase sigma-70 factor (ECF subfamily)
VRYCRAALRDPKEADDALQEAVLRAFRDIRRLDEGRSFRAFVFAYAAHDVPNRNRRARSRGRRETPIDGEPASPGAESELGDEAAHDRLLVVAPAVVAPAVVAPAVREAHSAERPCEPRPKSRSRAASEGRVVCSQVLSGVQRRCW